MRVQLDVRLLYDFFSALMHTYITHLLKAASLFKMRTNTKSININVRLHFK